jgi:thimet oligopeptidase
MPTLRSLAISLLLGGAASPVLAADYVPVSDAAIGPIRVAPKSVAEVAEHCGARIEAVKALRGRVEAMPLSTAPMSLLAAYDDLYNLALTAAYTEPGIIKDTHPDAGIRKAAEECTQRAGAELVGVSMSRPVYERLLRVQKAGVAPELRHMLERQIDNYRRAGVDKDETTRTRIAELQDRIMADSMAFQGNIAEDRRTVAARQDELKGLPEDWLAAHPVGADGMVQIAMAYPDVVPVLRYADDADLRQRVMTLFSSRAYPANDEVLKRIIADRAELARLLGYDSFAAFDLGNKMARSPARVQAFMDEIAGVARPIGEAEAARMLARLRKDDRDLAQLGSWSHAYASRLIRKEDYDVDPALVREYFAFDKVQAGILELTEHLFGVEIRPWSTEVWHEDVDAFEMVENGQVIGRFFLDMHPRDGKFTHAQMAPLRVGIAGRVWPVAVLETNFPKGLMEHGDVVTYLHEFGHLLHWIFSGRQPYAAQNAMELENDVVEAPSQLLEEWVWDYDTLKQFATNGAGEPIPAELVAKMNAGRRFGEAFGTMTQLGYAAVALDFYSGLPENRNLTDAYEASYGRYALTPDPEGAHNHASFGHLTGYGASYYTYSWSKALASDLLGEFRRNGMRDQATARRYRDLILVPGGSASMNTLVRNLLGRDWSVDAYRAELELGR